MRSASSVAGYGSFKTRRVHADLAGVEAASIDGSEAPSRRSGRRRGSVVAATALVVAAAVIVAVALISIGSTGSDAPASAVRFVVATLVPTALVVAYWLIVRRQVRIATTDLAARLGHERALVDRVSHQLRDQLTVIYGFSETLIDSDFGDPVEVRDVVSVINAEAVDLSRVVDDLVSAAELEAHAFEVTSTRFDPATEIERVVAPFRRRGHEVSVDCWSGVALSDSIRFRQIVRTLVSNAVRHGGPEIAVIGEGDGDTLRVTIADDGEGIDAALEREIFEGSDMDPRPRSEAGMGLGLAVARAVARELGGRLEYARVGDLTMVTLVLPTIDWPDRPAQVIVPLESEHSEDAESDDATAVDADEDRNGADEEAAEPPSAESPPQRRITFSDGTGPDEQTPVDEVAAPATTEPDAAHPDVDEAAMEAATPS